GVQGLGVLVAQEKHMPDLDTALYGQMATLRIRVARHDVAKVCNDGFRQISSPVHARVVKTFLVCATDEITHVGYGTVRDDIDRANRIDGAEIARHAAEGIEDFGFGGKPEAGVQPWNLAGLDFIEFMVAPQQEQPDRR